MRISDWSSDVCSSDLREVKGALLEGFEFRGQAARPLGRDADRLALFADRVDQRLHRPNRALAVGTVDEDRVAPFHKLAEDRDVENLLLPHRAHVTADELGEAHSVSRSIAHTFEIQSLIAI